MDDEVGRSLARLRSTRPSLDIPTAELASRLIRLGRHLGRSRNRALAPRGLESWEYDVLLALRTAPSPAGLTPSALLAATQVASGTMSNRIDRLARKGLLTREPDPSDHRGVLVRLTPTGRRRVDHALADVIASDEELLGSLTSRQRGQLDALLRHVLSGLED
jgi:DNA-binding MarR family transcriptional regulator